MKKCAGDGDKRTRHDMRAVMEYGVNHPTESEPELLRRARGGDLRAFETLVVRYQSGIRAYVVMRIMTKDDAEDLSQEAFVIAWRKLKEFEPGGSFGGWLRAIAGHLVRNHRRKFRAEGVGGYEELDRLWNEQLKEKTGDESDRLAALKDCLSRMDGPALGLLNDRYLDGMSVQELAEKTGKGYSALTTQLYRLRELLAICVENEMEALES
ncbi:MAG TPA: sigma-70 family RNA polymerase sigma factor [Luteolibacter sp.]|nr:sigma-70 family RNA polymerase sigma factor [Luteolibacter sp.]